ncbi:putative restriction/modification enzyme [Halorubrum aidingense JCM 13560]|uniref:site-specific DNA-methyltransferase (adenine-specific) n=1 Tax=Halorubrum aidingense JCM 13560 TaxID=1230454 RepID=M0PFQ0_9EURY|nr:Eco57I restriction-modification methylase domain-containing protein [Halorubrum aidingense]EMA67590.1 putative restriction/modification enzyme [Halorubrum aidingense JCM 13560]
MSQATLGSGPYRNSNLFSGYYLDERVSDLDAWDCDVEAQEAFDEINELWQKEAALLGTYNEDGLIDTWIAEVLDILGFDTISEATLPDGGGHVDRLLYENDDARREAAQRRAAGDVDAMFSQASAILEAKQWDANFEQRFAEQRSYRDASHQIKYYLERTPGDLRWGVLTDGKKWRLYGTKDYETQTYYEVDLPEVIESGNLEAFKYFFAFFRPEAFVEHSGSSFLDDVWTESETAAQELGEDLQDNVFRALRVLGKGFVESNDLDVGAEGEVDRDELKEQSLVLLYRLMFVLYAESRGLIDPDDPDDAEEYHEYFSLEAKREEILDDVEGMDVESGEAFSEEYSRFSSSIWGRLSELFELIDEGEEDLDIPPYNGGLFSQEDHAFLDDYEVKDPYIAEVIYWLSTTENEDGEHVPADYADLDTRHLGSIYEGLLEHEFRIADAEGVAAVSEDGGQVWKPASEVTAAEAVEIVEEGGLYVVNDEGERKATGAYYTTDYVVTYIVEETVDPLIDEIDVDLRDQGLKPSDREYFAEFYQRVKDLTVLDPAMGSGHFLTKATGYLTEQVMEVVREQEIQSYDEQEIRREISKEVIYGVDLNGMAVELSKLSMWLETLAADQPLAFLDHHLKDGNSLVGSDITEVLSDDTEESGGQLTLTQAFARVRQDTLEHVMELMADLLAYDNDSLESVKSMEELYDEIRDDPLYTRLFELANVHTAEEFGANVPEDAYEQMAGAIESEDDWATIRGEDWFMAAQVTADEQNFFHWELEFPEVFFDADGEKMPAAGFDAVIGNPPYVRQEKLSKIKDYVEENFRVYDGKADIYSYFFERGLNIARLDGTLGYISSNRFITANYGSSLRSYLAEESGIRKIIDFKDLPVFPGVTTSPAIFILEKETQSDVDTDYVDVEDLSFTDLGRYVESESVSIPSKNFGETWRLRSKRTNAVLDKVDEKQPLEDYIDGEINRGIVTGLNDAFVIDKETKEKLEAKDGDSSEIIKPFISGNEIRRFYHESPTEYLIYATWDLDINNYPAVKAHLEKWRDELESRPECQQGRFDWFCLSRYAADYESDFGSSKVIYPEVSKNARFAIDTEGIYPNKTAFIIPHQDYHLLSILNSTISELYLHSISSRMRGGYYMNSEIYVENIPIAGEEDIELSRSDVSHVSNLLSEYSEIRIKRDSVEVPSLSPIGKIMVQLQEQRERINPDLLDNLGNYKNAVEISTIGLLSPAENSPTSVLSETKAERSNLRIGDARVNRESPNTVLIEATARYKPDDEDAHETDRWGYTETEYLPAFRITDLTETEADLIEHFVPVAVDEAGGFANFRETATKTKSLVDRLKAIELPDVDDVADDLENYLRTKERAEELDAKIEQTDKLIDEIVYELYGLTEEEIEIVEEAVA